jgi:hypothetical protein
MHALTHISVLAPAPASAPVAVSHPTFQKVASPPVCCQQLPVPQYMYALHNIPDPLQAIVTVPKKNSRLQQQPCGAVQPTPPTSGLTRPPPVCMLRALVQHWCAAAHMCCCSCCCSCALQKGLQGLTMPPPVCVLRAFGRGMQMHVCPLSTCRVPGPCAWPPV